MDDLKIINFSALRVHFEKFNDFEAILKGNLQILPWNCIFAHGMTPIFGSPHQKKPPFFWWPHWMTPFFRRNLTLNAPYFRSPVGTCRSLSYLSAPPWVRTWHLTTSTSTEGFSQHGCPVNQALNLLFLCDQVQSPVRLLDCRPIDWRRLVNFISY